MGWTCSLGAQRLPIVAPKAGGISELISDKTGWLVRNPLDAIEYANNLRECLASDPTERTKALVDLIATRHSFETFCGAVEKLVEAPPA
ncbi:MAG TPA: hypothetical protein VGI22_12220 [Xanthobacteraceae bacterium]|jgi:glycosyltransferase involved in cell wall biosynthesis